MKIAVIGRGLWGAAAARHLALSGADVTLIGPSEPVDKTAHHGVFGSHYDEGRITRKNASDPYWARISIASIDRYAEIEAQSGIGFYTEAGAVLAGGADYMALVEASRAACDISCDMLDRAALAQRFAFFDFPDHFTGYHEVTRAGHISPRRLVEAQTKAAQNLGAKLLPETVDGINERPNTVEVITAHGRHSFDQVLVAAGYNTDRVLGRDAQLQVFARTIAFFEVPPAEALRLKSMPTLIYEAAEDPYLLPPIKYPDGKLYIKLGGDPDDVPLSSEKDVGDWFRSGGNRAVRDHQAGILRSLMPDLNFTSLSMGACVTSWTKDRRPEVARLSNRLSVCTGGNGAGAKCSDEIGRLGAALILEETGD